MEQSEEDKLNLIASYLVEEIPQSHVQIQPFKTASPVYVLTVKTPKQQHRLEVCRPLIEDRSHSLSEVKSLLVRDDLAQKIQQFNRERYYWNPV
jgi:CRISPR/Cas system endoribonuclease Cas6 (RAMP superfamily)